MNLLEQETCPTTEYRTIPLSRGLVTLVDPADYEWLSQFRWGAHRTKPYGCFYAARKTSKKLGPPRMVYMHREILGLQERYRCGDHINGKTLDNRRCNLRVATPIQNGMNRGANKNNTSGYKGVHRSQTPGKWQAVIVIHGKAKFLGGTYLTPEAAHEAYARAAREHFGEFAKCS